jgi:uncharacterized membrane-anchored protein
LKSLHLPRALLLLFAALAAGRLPAATPAELDPAARLAEMRRLAESVHYREGVIALPGGVARLSLPAGYRYLGPEDASTVLSRIWGNPANQKTLGMILPEAFDPLRRGSWAVVLSYTDEGHVKDDDAGKINYDELLQKMKEGAAAESKVRAKEGYPPIELVGWAAPPRYDAAAHKLYWAKEFKFGDQGERTLNYNIRILGRSGVLVLNAVAEMPELPQVEAATPTLLSMVDFEPGHRYADYKSGTDKVATYGIAGLVAGGIAAKVGLLKGLWVGILALKKFIIVGLLALSRYAKKIWTRLRGRGPAAGKGPAASLDPPAGSA